MEAIEKDEKYAAPSFFNWNMKLIWFLFLLEASYHAMLLLMFAKVVILAN